MVSRVYKSTGWIFQTPIYMVMVIPSLIMLYSLRHDFTKMLENAKQHKEELPPEDKIIQ
ncbi:hypothetical protein [Vibrio cholerae]|uniref:hypothetical protein n=1 Tax=Vibrio cholerae TaxID=666 RepID=UPI0013B027EC|nr:hypothetical protein [Vibrio cholerae]